ncbi:hypothetical protein GlitD10_1761 [Gloeomargarita lithophora Alchichica-D10]|uniref:Transposase (putative) YhgA-like domain-containing protein n=2 Tax=Gloeomargarita lithophora Alchichica-D10 TaxID=1188229 RepID=A0A1J0ADU8_9CYAN|nr:Rpn family recombination-promoting nuclease/putative transposase [Gloeomargarita lithophora]APB34087.1 hypothetical protein GlitD10_1761 [Gloeomargarita lithophora Alchichica-D10]
MKTDNLFYKLFQIEPSLVFDLMGLPVPNVAYQFQSLELKEFSLRLDGLFVPDSPDSKLPLILIEAQMQPDERLYTRIQNELSTYIHQYQPPNPVVVLVIYPERTTERPIANLSNYLAYWGVHRIYLAEIPAQKSLGGDLLRLMVLPPAQVVAVGQDLLRRIRQDGAPDDYVEWVVETLVRRFPQSARSKIMEMLGLVELKQTRFYQEVYGEGKVEGKVEGKAEGQREERREIARNLLKANFSPEQVAQLTRLPLAEVQELNSSQPGVAGARIPAVGGVDDHE